MKQIGRVFAYTSLVMIKSIPTACHPESAEGERRILPDSQNDKEKGENLSVDPATLLSDLKMRSIVLNKLSSEGGSIQEIDTLQSSLATAIQELETLLKEI